LHQYGGVYLDIDTVIVKPFDSASLYQYDTVLGMEAKMLEYRNGRASDDEMSPKGLCNAVIVARPGAVFLERWIEAYEDFDGTNWSKQSIVAVTWSFVMVLPS
jgi:mannosyltransferase OCH1-like enzyme